MELSYGETITELSKDKLVLIIGGINKSSKYYGFIKNNNIKYLNLPTEKDKLIDYKLDLKSSTDLEITQAIPHKFDVICFEYLPSCVYSQVYKKLHLITKDKFTLLVKGFDFDRIESMYDFNFKELDDSLNFNMIYFDNSNDVEEFII